MIILVSTVFITHSFCLCLVSSALYSFINKSCYIYLVIWGHIHDMRIETNLQDLVLYLSHVGPGTELRLSGLHLESWLPPSLVFCYYLTYTSIVSFVLICFTINILLENQLAILINIFSFANTFIKLINFPQSRA